MKFSISWLRRHLETEAGVPEIVDAMISAGLEVEHVDDPRERLAAFSVARIETAERHPDADRLQVCQVATKDGRRQIVCGAPNARAGLYVAYGPVGAYVPGADLTLKKARIRGVESAGMLCSAAELELSGESEGILELGEAAADLQIGAALADVLGLDDALIDFESTPNRPDWLGVDGVARELAAAGLGRLITPPPAPVAPGFACPHEIGLDFPAAAAGACPAFYGRLVRGVRNGPSPAWLQALLTRIGLRPISALVDVTNFLTFDRARPLHVYDADKLQGRIHARLGRPGEEVAALDGKTYAADETMCVIADDSGAIGFGGVIGGESTGCTEETVNVLIESAYFDPGRTRATGRALGVVSDARYRFERGVDPGFLEGGLELATALIQELCGGEASEIVRAGAPPAGPDAFSFRPALVRRLTGADYGLESMRRVLTDQGCTVTDEAGEGAAEAVWRVAPPTWRGDLEQPADLVEEVARVNGYDTLPMTSLPAREAVATPIYSPDQRRRRRVRRTLAARGLLETVTWSFCLESDAALFSAGEQWVAARGLRLANPISQDLGVMRPSILPHLVRAAQRNADRGEPGFAGFEVGPHYAGTKPDDQTNCAAGVRTPRGVRHWRGAAEPDAFTVKADALSALEAAGASPAALQTSAEAPAWYHPGRSGVLKLGPKNVLAAFGELHPRVLKSMNVDGPLFAFEVFLDAAPSPRGAGRTDKPRLAAEDLMPVRRDFAFVVAQDVSAEALIRAVRAADKTAIVEVALFDVYDGPGVGDGRKSLAVEVTFQPRGKTYTDQDLETLSARVVAAARDALGAELRA